MQPLPISKQTKKQSLFQQLYEYEYLLQLDKTFLKTLSTLDPTLYNRILESRIAYEGIDPKQESQLLIDLAPYVENFLINLFDINLAVQDSYQKQNLYAPLYICKRTFIQKRFGKLSKTTQIIDVYPNALRKSLEKLFKEPFTDLSFATNVIKWLQDQSTYEQELNLATSYASWAIFTEEGRTFHHHSLVFKIQEKRDPFNLISIKVKNHHDIEYKYSPYSRHREGFGLADPGITSGTAIEQANYCIWCHNQSKDSCSKGFKPKDDVNERFEKNVFQEKLTGCPLEEKISEMNFVKAKGFNLAALAIIAVDNPMVAATGHRICNDCVKACIYQKQDPVNIPQIETSILDEVLALPWGFEIYSLLTRWNPMNIRRPLPKSSTGYKVLVVGLGPAGFTLSHHLLNEGHAVVAVDGLKIEPLPVQCSGIDIQGNRSDFEPIRNVQELYENLDNRVIGGFGGVSEYGITVRWNKNYLKLIRLLLERRKEFLAFGGIRFGGTITIDQAFDLGFDHIALCSGAGKPTILPLKNTLAKGVRQASDFLMALQLTGAANVNSISNLQIRLPVIVIGGGLTAIDTATEAMAYYPVQVEKILKRHEILVSHYGEDKVQAQWTEEDKATFEIFRNHALLIRHERERAKIEKRQANIQKLIQSWGGVTVAYRRRLVDAPSYTRNHEEVSYAFEEGIWFAENLSPIEIKVDKFGHVTAVDFEQKVEEQRNLKTLPAHTVLIAAGTVPNTVLEKEDPNNIKIDGKHFVAVDETGEVVQPEELCKPNKVHVLTSIRSDHKAISFFGDLHPSFSGNVVKAMASAKRGYPILTRMLSRLKPTKPNYQELWQQLNREFRATVHSVTRLTPTIVEVTIKAPLAAKAFKPGQFYRLQNFNLHNTHLHTSKGGHEQVPLMEGIALTGAWVDIKQGLISTIVLEMGGSSNICKFLKPNQPVVLMGPTGEATHIPSNETVLLVGGGLGNAVLISIGAAMRKANCKVLYFAGYKKIEDRYKVEQLENAADQIIWCCDEHPGFKPTRPQDGNFVGNIIEALKAYADGKIGANFIPFKSVNRIITIGSDGMMAAVAKARHTILKDKLNPSHTAIGSINSPMQCMMKEICAQCLQIHIDPVSKKEKIVFSCFNQDQNLDHVDFSCLRDRLKQNSLQEKITKLWIDHSFCQPNSLHHCKEHFI